MPFDKKVPKKAAPGKDREVKQDVTDIPLDFEESSDGSREENISAVLESARRKRESVEEYEKQSEPKLSERSYNWKTAIGSQQVDGLTPSRYLLDTANANIKGEISIDEAERFIMDYYENKPESDCYAWRRHAGRRTDKNG